MSGDTTSRYVNPHRNSYLFEALHQLLDKNAVELVKNPQSLGFCNRLFLVPKPNNRWRPILDLGKLNTFLKTQSFKMETPETIRTSLQTGEWVTSIDFKDAYFHIPINSQSMRFHIQGEPYQFKALLFGLSTAPMEFTVVAKEVKLLAMKQGITTHQYRLVRARSHQTYLQHTQTLVAPCRELGLLVNKEKSELEPKQVFNFVGYQFNLKEGRVRPTPECWQVLQTKIQEIMSSPVCPARKLMSLIGLLTATEKSALGPLTHETHTVASQKQLEGTRDNGKDHPHSKITPPTSSMVAGVKQCYYRSTITPSKTCSANLYRRIKRRVGRSLKRAHSKGKLVAPRKQTAHKLPRVKGSLSGLKRVSGPLYQQHSPHSYRQHYSGCLHKQGRGNEVGPLVCPTVENTDLVYQELRNSQSSSHRRPYKRDSRQAIQTGPDHSNRMSPQSRGLPSNMQPVAQAPSGPICHQVQQQAPTVVSQVPYPQAWAVDALSLSWDGLDPYAFPPAAILGKVVEKMLDYPCSRIILIAPGWPNMPWFWDLGAMSSQIPPCLPILPNLVTQPFNQTLHKNLSNLNLHAWLLEPQQLRSRVSLRQWQHELRLLKDQPDQSMRQSGPFLQSGASLIRWTSGHHL